MRSGTLSRTLRGSIGRVLAASLLVVVSGCGGGPGANSAVVSQTPPGPSPSPPPPPATNSAPVVSGAPAESVIIGQPYSFIPNASDPDGDELTFSIENRPAWTTFDQTTGTLEGTAPLGSEGQYAGIRISASDGMESASLAPFSIEVLELPNTAPSISGTPPISIVVGQPYSFTPAASDDDGDSLTFSIDNRPFWANFDEATGTLAAIAPAGSEGNYANIRISVSDGRDTASLAPFEIDVLPIALGSATITWQPPTRNTDGSTLTDLAGYRIHYGTSSETYTTELQLDNPGLTSYVVENLVPDTYFFVVTALNQQGFESAFSNELMMEVDVE